MTGLHIGGSETGIEIGGVDKTVIRDKLTNRPYIPGSSLRGKTRSLLEKYRGLRQNQRIGQGYIHSCDDASAYPTCDVCQVFGVPGEHDSATPTRLVVRDTPLTPKSAAELEQIARTDLPFTEVKTEVSIDRVTSAATPRQMERVPAGGPTFRAAYRQALRALQEDGLGGERSAGYGAFVWREGAAVTLPDPLPGRPAWLLSRYHPRASELPRALAGEGAAYALTMIGGWVHSPDGSGQRRRRLLLVGEGGLIYLADHVAGDVVDMRPRYRHAAGDLPHPVYRYGLALAIPSPAGPTRLAKEGARV